jgi:tetratricopeptide (TPR) repeat protein
LAVMYHQSNTRWKQGGNAESLFYTNLALQQQKNPFDLSHNDHRLRRSMMLHQSNMLYSLGRRNSALIVLNQLLDLAPKSLPNRKTASDYSVLARAANIKQSIISLLDSALQHWVGSLYQTTMTFMRNFFGNIGWLQSSSSSVPTSTFQQESLTPREWSNVLFHKGELLMTLFDDFSAAIVLFRQALEVYPCNYYVYVHLVHAMQATKNVTSEEWMSTIGEIERYAANIRKPYTRHSGKHMYKYQQPALEYHLPVVKDRHTEAGQHCSAASLEYNNTVSTTPSLLANLQNSWSELYDAYLVPDTYTVCKFDSSGPGGGGGGAGGADDIFASLSAVRTITTFSTIMSSLSWAQFFAADSVDVSVNVTQQHEPETPTPASFSSPQQLLVDQQSVSVPQEESAVVGRAWWYLQQARHHDRLRMNEQHVHMQYQALHSQLQQRRENQQAQFNAPGGGGSRSEEEEEEEGEDFGGVEVQIGVGDGGGTDSKVSGRGGARPKKSARRAVFGKFIDDDDLIDGYGRINQLSFLTLEEQLDRKETIRASKQAQHIENFFEAGYWGKGDYYNVTGNIGKMWPNAPLTTIADAVAQKSKTRIPVFVVGFFRSGSTLLEDLLEKHSTPIALEEVENSHCYEKEALETLGFQRKGIWGMGEDSPFVFDMYSMQEQTLQAYQEFEKKKAELKATGKTSPSQDDSKNKKPSKKELKLQKVFMTKYQTIIQQKAGIILSKMLNRFEQYHAPDLLLPEQSDHQPSLGTNHTADSANPSAATSTATSPGLPPPAHIVDKMLSNFVNIGLIHMVFPRAIILHTIRDPLDTLFSCYANR